MSAAKRWRGDVSTDDESQQNQIRLSFNQRHRGQGSAGSPLPIVSLSRAGSATGAEGGLPRYSSRSLDALDAEVAAVKLLQQPDELAVALPPPEAAAAGPGSAPASPRKSSMAASGSGGQLARARLSVRLPSPGPGNGEGLWDGTPRHAAVVRTKSMSGSGSGGGGLPMSPASLSIRSDAFEAELAALDHLSLAAELARLEAAAAAAAPRPLLAAVGASPEQRRWAAAAAAAAGRCGDSPYQSRVAGKGAVTRPGFRREAAGRLQQAFAGSLGLQQR
jgi:hypothetical protein